MKRLLAVLVLLVSLSACSGAGTPTTTPQAAMTSAAVQAPEPSGGTNPAACPTPLSGALTDGRLTVAVPSTWKPLHPVPAEWAECSAVAGREVDRKAAPGWLTLAFVAWLPDTGPTSQQVGELVWMWHRSNNYESANPALRIASDQHAGQTVTQVGTTGYKITGQITVTGLEGVKGDEITILVVENTDKSHSVLMTASAIDDAQSRADVQAISASLRVA